MGCQVATIQSSGLPNLFLFLRTKSQPPILFSNPILFRFFKLWIESLGMMAIDGCCFECPGTLEHLWILMGESWDHCNFSGAICHCNIHKDQNKCWKEGNHEHNFFANFHNIRESWRCMHFKVVHFWQMFHSLKVHTIVLK